MKYSFHQGKFRSNGQELVFHFEVCLFEEYFEIRFSGVYTTETGLAIKSVNEYIDAFDCSFINWSGVPVDQLIKDCAEVQSTLRSHSLKAKTFREKAEKFLKEFFCVDTINYE